MTRQSNLSRRNKRIRSLFDERYTTAQRPRKYTREYVIACLAEEFYLSMARIEDIIYKTEKKPQ